MSFILDALRKSETERQRGIGPSFSDVKSTARGRRIPILWIGVGLLLLINVVALGVLLVRRSDSAQAVAPPTPVAPVAAPTAGAQPARASLPATSAAVASPLPAAAAPSAGVAENEGAEQTVPEPLLDRPQLSNYASDARLPTMNDVIMQGRARLPELHLDMHVFVQAPDQRFVSINSHKLREGMQIEEGLRVERITPDGVVLNDRGLRFLLPRQ
jgi:general secretion pathway protein B